MCTVRQLVILRIGQQLHRVRRQQNGSTSRVRRTTVTRKRSLPRRSAAPGPSQRLQLDGTAVGSCHAVYPGNYKTSGAQGRYLEGSLRRLPFRIRQPAPPAPQRRLGRLCGSGCVHFHRVCRLNCICFGCLATLQRRRLVRRLRCAQCRHNVVEPSLLICTPTRFVSREQTYCFVLVTHEWPVIAVGSHLEGHKPSLSRFDVRGP